MMRRRGNRSRRLVAVIIIVLVALLVAGAVFWWFNIRGDSKNDAASQPVSKSEASPANNPPAAQPAQDAHKDRIRILAAGDFIAHDSINAQAKQSDGSYNYMPMMQDFAPLFAASDVRFCNEANLTGGAQFGISGYPKFNAPTEFARDTAKVGCNVVNTGTNHSFDRTQAAIDASVASWEGLPGVLAVAGQNRSQAEHDTVHYFTVKGVKFAFLAYTTYLNVGAPAQNNYGVNVYSNDFAASQIKTAKANGAQFILTSIRWGTEYSPDVNSSQKQVAQFLSDQGVDVIIGHGSHVLQPVQEITGTGGNKTMVWYSIGNFLNTQLPPETLFNGVGVIDVDATTRKITAQSFLPLYVHYEWSAADAAAENLLARKNIRMYLLEEATQSQIDTQQLKTTVDAQKTRIQNTLNTYLKIPLITKSDYLK